MNGQLFHQGKPVSSADLIAYLEMAKIALNRDDVRDQIAEGMDISDEELERLTHQLGSSLGNESPATVTSLLPTTVDLTPEVLKTPEGMAHVNEVLAKKDTANAEAAYLLKDLYRDIGREKLREILVEGFGHDEADSMVRRVVDAIHNVDKCTNELLLALVSQNDRIGAMLDKIEEQKE